MSPRRLVTSELLRIYRPVVLWFLAVMILCAGIGMTAVSRVTDPTFSLWVMIFGTASKCWLVAVGAVLISLHLRQFVTNGITRRAFMAGSALFGLLAVVLFALAVPLGHGVEQVLLGIGGPLPPGYPTVSAGAAAGEFGHVLPSSLAFLVAGAAISAGFYRFGALGGLALIIPSVLPIGVAEALLGADGKGRFDTGPVPYAVALLISLAVTALAALLFHRATRHVAIRPAPG